MPRVTLSPDGNPYNARFHSGSLRTAENQVAHIVGTISVPRIDLDTTDANDFYASAVLRVAQLAYGVIVA